MVHFESLWPGALQILMTDDNFLQWLQPTWVHRFLMDYPMLTKFKVTLYGLYVRGLYAGCLHIQHTFRDIYKLQYTSDKISLFSIIHNVDRCCQRVVIYQLLGQQHLVTENASTVVTLLNRWKTWIIWGCKWIQPLLENLMPVYCMFGFIQ